MENTYAPPLLIEAIPKTRLVFIDSSVEDYHSLVAGVLRDTEVAILDADQDGVEQISAFLAQRVGINSLHIISHGAPGRVYLGNSELGQQTLNRYASQLMNWAKALSADAQILLYGCDVAQTDIGKVFVQRLSEFTGATVLASNSRTGSAALGGNWKLEFSTASTSASLAFASATLETYGAVLAKPYLVNDLTPGLDGSNASYLTNVNGTLFFFTTSPFDTDLVSLRLWKSDGTKPGTVALEDISPLLFNNANPEGLTSFDGILYFLTDSYGYKLWKSDGTPEGTVDVVNFGGHRYYPSSLVQNINGNLYFQVGNEDYNDGYDYHYDLWKSDGTEAGTFLLKELYPGESFVGIRSSLNFNGTLYFAVSKSGQNVLWKSDGTTAGTIPFKELSNVDIANLTQVKDIFYFTTGYPSELWKSDGTENGTVKVSDIASSYLRNINDTLYFLADSNPEDFSPNYELWKSDGTPGGTVLIKDIKPGVAGSFADSYDLRNFANINDVLYFYADNGTNGYELWKSNGTAAGTMLVKDIRTGSAGSTINDQYDRLVYPTFTNVDGILYFIADDGIHGGELWKTDGTTAGTVLVKDIKSGSASSNISSLINVDDTLYFIADDGIHGSELWQSDGTQAGTFLVEDIKPGSSGSNISSLTKSDRTLYFMADDGTHGYELWALNTNSPVASPIVSITAIDANAAEAGNNPAVFRISRTGDLSNELTVIYDLSGTALNGKDYNKLNGTITIAANQSFVDLTITPASDTYPEGDETVTLTLFDQYYQYYAVDPTKNAASATIADDISTIDRTQLYPVKDIYLGPGSSNISNLRNVNNTLFFSTFDGSNKLWKSDGTNAGTVLVKDISNNSPSYLTPVNNILYFLDYSKPALWRSDGTETGTFVVKEGTAPNNDYSYIFNLSNVNNTVFFIYDNYSSTNGDTDELWKTDGTTAGTVLVKDISARNLTNFNNTLYFTSKENTLWKSNGTAEGTVLVKTINNSSIRSGLINVNGTLFFDVYNSNTRSDGLWKSDGTAAGTVLVKTINPNGIDYFNNATNVNGTLFFTAYNETYGNELWKSNGTTEGTVLVKDINPGAGYYEFYNLTNVNGILYFTIDDRLWRSDGTAEGTVLVKDINPESNYNVPRIFNLANANGTIYFGADDGIHGYELWKSDGTEAGTVLVQDLNPGTASSNPSNFTHVNDTLYFTADDGIQGNELWAIKTSNIINGNNGRDPVVGTDGSDRIIGGTGKKTITGGAGNDEFVYTNIREVGHRITDFTVGEDKIVLTQLLDSLVPSGYNGNNAISDGYVRLVQGSKANSSILQIDRDGAVGNAVFRAFIELDNVTPQEMNNTQNFVF